MSDYDNTDTGALFKNDKNGNATWPDYRGSVNVGGTEYWLSAWIKTSKQGTKFMSLSVKPKDEAPRQKAAPASSGGVADMPDDDLPF